MINAYGKICEAAEALSPTDALFFLRTCHQQSTSWRNGEFPESDLLDVLILKHASYRNGCIADIAGRAIARLGDAEIQRQMKVLGLT